MAMVKKKRKAAHSFQRTPRATSALWNHPQSFAGPNSWLCHGSMDNALRARFTKPFVAISRCTYDTFCSGNVRRMYQTCARGWNRSMRAITASHRKLISRMHIHLGDRANRGLPLVPPLAPPRRNDPSLSPWIHFQLCRVRGTRAPQDTRLIKHIPCKQCSALANVVIDYYILDVKWSTRECFICSVHGDIVSVWLALPTSLPLWEVFISLTQHVLASRIGGFSFSFFPVGFQGSAGRFSHIKLCG